MITAQAKVDTRRICERAIEALRVKEYERLGSVQGKAKQQALSKTLGAAHVAVGLLAKWVADASPGDRRSYFVTTVDYPLSIKRRADLALDCVAGVALSLAEAGYVTLVQQQSPAGDDLTYEMRRTGKGFAPRQAVYGRVGSSPSPAFGGHAPSIGDDGGFTMPNRSIPIMGQPRPNMDEGNADNR